MHEDICIRNKKIEQEKFTSLDMNQPSYYTIEANELDQSIEYDYKQGIDYSYRSLMRQSRKMDYSSKSYLRIEICILAEDGIVVYNAELIKCITEIIANDAIRIKYGIEPLVRIHVIDKIYGRIDQDIKEAEDKLWALKRLRATFEAPMQE